MTEERRSAAQANQRAAAFVRLSILGDHEAMHHVLSAVNDGSDLDRMAFTTALASLASTFGTSAFGRDELLSRLEVIANTSAALHAADDVDAFFDDLNGGS